MEGMLIKGEEVGGDILEMVHQHIKVKISFPQVVIALQMVVLEELLTIQTQLMVVMEVAVREVWEVVVGEVIVEEAVEPSTTTLERPMELVELQEVEVVLFLAHQH
jgi:hypothetical protein